MLAKFNRKKFREEVTIAFDDVHVPQDHQMIVETTYWECLEMEEAFKGIHWKTMSAKLAHWYGHSLICFAPEAFHFFLPALMILSLTDPEASDVSEFLMDQLLPVDEGDRMQIFNDRMKLFTSAQVAVVKKYIKRHLDANPYFSDEGTLKAKELWKLD